MTDEEMIDEETPAEERRRSLMERESAETEDDRIPDVPVDVVAEAERLTRLARDADRHDDGTGALGETPDGPDEAAAYRARRDDLLAAHGYACRVREDDGTLVLHPAEWVEDGEIRVDRIDDTDRAVEVSLSGTGTDEEWADVESHNASLVSAVEERHGPAHAANARALADFMGNHYAKEIERATGEELAEFLAEYYPRNAWPSARERELVEKSVALVFEVAGVPVPTVDRER